MKKTIRILSIVTLAIATLSLLLLLGIALLQVPLALLFPDVLDAEAMYFPLSGVSNALLVATLATALLLTAERGVWIDFLLIAVKLLVLPQFNNIILSLEVLLQGENYGYTANALSSIPTQITALGTSLFLVVCGMSIVYKFMSKKALPAND